MRALHSEPYQEFLRLLRSARQAAGLTQWDVAHHLKRPQSYVSKCESGERRVDVIELAEFAHLYKRKIEFFLPK
jgi:ribosome-binding protein aMBF1 (putative translation factor)